MFGLIVSLAQQPNHLVFVPEEHEQGQPEKELETAQLEGRAEDDRWYLRKDGSRFNGNSVLTALTDQGTTDGFAKILRDLARQRQAEEERDRLV